MKIKFIEDTRNIRTLKEAMTALTMRNKELPGLGLICGKAGLGKTLAVKWYVTQFDCLYFRSLSIWSLKSMLQEICTDLGQDPEGTNQNIFRQIEGELKNNPRLIFIDESDYLVNARKWHLLETLRDLHDLTASSFVFIGEQNIKNKLAKRHRVWSRISQVVEFIPLVAEEIAFIAHELTGLNIPDEIADRLAKETGGDFRDVMVALAYLEQIARTNSRDTITKKMVEMTSRAVLKKAA